MNVCEGISSSPQPPRLHQPPCPPPSPAQRPTSRVPSGGRLAGGLSSHSHTNSLSFSKPHVPQEARAGEGSGEACGGSRQLCLPFPSLHPFVRRSVFLLLKGSEGEKSRRGLGLSGHSCSTLEFFSLEDPQQIETTERTLQHCHPRQNQDLAPQSGSAATWPCDTGPVPRPSADNNPIISTTCCSPNSYHEPGAACFI